MKIKSKLVLACMMTIVLIVATVSPALAATSAPGAIDYVALGDSCAAGVRAMPGELPGWEEGSDFGYTDLVANWLEDEGILGKFDEKYSISGNTAAELADATTKADGYQRLRKAEIVTLTIGANDFLGPLYAYYDACVAGEAVLTTQGAYEALQVCMAYYYSGGAAIMKDDLKTILQNTLRASPEVKIYVMGYYNPLPILIEMLGPTADLAPFVMMLNGLIQAAIIETMLEHPGASIDYIETLGVINGYDGTTYVSGPLYAYALGYLYADTSVPIADIHFTQAGYAKVSELFIAAISADM